MMPYIYIYIYTHTYAHGILPLRTAVDLKRSETMGTRYQHGCGGWNPSSIPRGRQWHAESPY